MLSDHDGFGHQFGLLNNLRGRWAGPQGCAMHRTVIDLIGAEVIDLFWRQQSALLARMARLTATPTFSFPTSLGWRFDDIA